MWGIYIKIISIIKRGNNIHILETICIASLLSMVGGYVDAYTYLTRGQVFAYAATGNIVLFAISIIHSDLLPSHGYLFSIISFILGIFVSQYIKLLLNNIIEWRYIIILINIIVLVFIGFISNVDYNVVVSSIISFISAAQMSSFTKVEGVNYVSSMCTGNLRSALENLFNYIASRNISNLRNAIIYFTLIFFFILGAFLSALITSIIGVKSIWIASIILLFILTLMFLDEKIA